MNWQVETKHGAKISVDLEKCCACRSCELACSFHHHKRFDPACSSIRVHREDGEGILEISLISTCDGCSGEKLPWCVRFCSSGCLRVASG